MLGKLRYAVDEIAANYDRRTWWQNRTANRIIAPIQAQLHNSDGIRVLDREWDTLLVLDACRADLFEEVVETETYDSYERVYSAGSATNEWVRANFSGPAQTDCVYVTGNPVVSRQVETAFHHFLEPWREEFDPEIGTVPPEPVTETALAAREQFPEKRLIVHYLQPHYPFIEAPHLRYAEFNGTEEVTVKNAKPGATDIWEAVGLGYENPDDVWDAYADNLRRVMDAIEPLLDQPGRTVITSDHGNMLGEQMPLLPMGLYGHPPGIHHPILREVPWAVVDGESTVDSDRRVTADVKEQLRSLGYAD
ncbi:hypothetical protein ACFOZ7_01240 [Natribaculum luteum]|uniref:Uncharacterized protein n=1 Tax=Natribaculum luteum TaxID=1586232 RepID=A0ABD5NV16_9EURY|nr:hypothetical protein [Natribaculum luteum]